MKLRLIVLSVFLLLIKTGSANSQPVKIYGKAPAYAGMEIVFYTYSDWLTYGEKEIAQCQIDMNGNFSVDIPLESVQMVFAYLGIYRAYFYAVPAGSYELDLPPDNPRTEAEKLNPYFRYTDMHLGIKNAGENDLNIQIMQFDNAYNGVYNKHIDNAGITEQEVLDADITALENEYKSYRENYFEGYRHYMYGLLYMLSRNQRAQSLSDNYFNNYPVLYNNPVYGELFNQVYDKYFVFFGRSELGRKIYSDINSERSYSALLNTIKSNLNFSNDTLMEIVVLKQLHDEYYSDQFSRPGLLNILDTLINVTSINEHRLIGLNIRNKITKLQSGYDPPWFRLSTTDGDTMELSDFKGHYVYLNFCTLQSYSCLNEFNILSGMNERLKDRLTVLTITTDPAGADFVNFKALNGFNWTFLHYEGQPEILKDYDIRAFPTYFLVGPDGKLLLSPAPSPAENFEQRLFEIMRSRGDL